jgi:DNA invertase Pin-like site-specific DNA recombinase
MSNIAHTAAGVGAADAAGRAAVYLRKSSDLQQYSLENQMKVISDYARSRSIEIVRVYQDAGRSGLSLRKRKGLQQLISDARAGVGEFSIILVYDLSRWGRFQDVDESSHLEFVCRQAGVAVEYCAERFSNDGGMLATLMKGFKRTMAGEFSRDLSAKVFQGQSRLIRMGFHQGGPAGFALRRVLVDREGRRKGEMRPGQRKSFQDDRVILIPGPKQEVKAVRDVFRLYAEEGYSATQLATHLNQQGFRNSYGRAWTNDTVNDLLRNERYIGTLTYNRISLKLQSPQIINPKTKWIRGKGAIQPIVAERLFALTQARLGRGREFSDDDLLNRLTAVWCVKGQLTGNTITECPGSPSLTTLKQRFGGLKQAFKLVGYRQTHRYRYAKFADTLRLADRELIYRLTCLTAGHGGLLNLDPISTSFKVDGGYTVSTVILPYTRRKGGRPGWWLFSRYIVNCDYLLLVRMQESNTSILDIHLLPSPLIVGPSVRFTSEKMAALTRYSLRSAADFHAVLRGCFVGESADRCH